MITHFAPRPVLTTRRWMSRTILVLPLTFSAVTSGCAALSKGESLEVRYFTLPAHVPSPRASANTTIEAPDSDKGTPKAQGLRVGAIVGSVHLEERIVYRPSPSELGYYTSLRWTEPPERWLSREFTAQLFEERGVKQLIGVVGPILEVELTVFEEVIGPPHIARVQLLARLQDGKAIFWQETLSVEVPIAPPEAKVGDDDDEGAAAEREAIATVDAMGAAMMAIAHQLVDRVEAELGRLR